MAQALGKLAAEQAVNSLIHVWRNDPITDVREAAKYSVLGIYEITQNSRAEQALKRAGYRL